MTHTSNQYSNDSFVTEESNFSTLKGSAGWNVQNSKQGLKKCIGNLLQLLLSYSETQTKISHNVSKQSLRPPVSTD